MPPLFTPDEMRHLARFSCPDPDQPQRPQTIETDITEPTGRSAFTRDRDRILYTKAFRRLAHKTQVYFLSTRANNASDHVRTRLTHTLEVSQIARTLARHLAMNEDLVEAIAYGHDVGHAPFGHAGEQQLNDILNGKYDLKSTHNLASRIDWSSSRFASGPRSTTPFDLGDFRHNFQSVRQLMFLDGSRRKYSGLNLTLQVLDGILHHTSTSPVSSNRSHCRYPDTSHGVMHTLLSRNTFDPTLESAIVALSDEIAQVCHDLSDAVDADTISFHELKQQLDSHIQAATPFLSGRGQEFQFGTSADDRLPNNRKFCSMLISWFTISTALEIANQILEHDPSTPVADVLLNLPSTPCPAQHFSAVKRFKDDLAINNFNVNRTDNKGRYIIRQLYHAYIEDPRQLPDADLKRYLFLKQKELQARRSDGILDWLAQANAVLMPDSRLSPQDHQKIIDVIQGGQAITFFRTGDAAFINKITPVLFQDADYVRTIVDYIAAMTDIFAENEMVCLYG